MMMSPALEPECVCLNLNYDTIPTYWHAQVILMCLYFSFLRDTIGKHTSQGYHEEVRKGPTKDYNGS